MLNRIKIPSSPIQKIDRSLRKQDEGREARSRGGLWRTMAAITPAKRVRRGVERPSSHRSALVKDLRRLPVGNPLVTAIILNRDGAAFLETLFSGIARHNSWKALEIILVDHASSDGSIEVARRWADRLSIKIVPRTANDSFSHADNRVAVELARGEMLLFLNNDVVLTEDIIPRMVAAVEATDGIVGIRQYALGWLERFGLRRIVHIGVRFFWKTRERFVAPRDVRPVRGDELLASSPVRMPAVTGSILMCRRADYLALGGMCEEYFYSYEDIDLCCKFRFRLQRTILCLNDIAAFHRVSATRKRLITGRNRRTTLKRNEHAFDARYGFALWRDFAVASLEDDGSFRGRTPGVAILGKADDSMLAPLCRGFEQRGWRVDQTNSSRRLDLADIDIVIETNPHFAWSQARRATPMLCRVAWVGEQAEQWALRGDLGAFDLAIASNDDIADQLRSAGAAAIRILPNDQGSAEALRLALIDRRQKHYRFALLAAGTAEMTKGIELAEALAKAGQTAWVARAGDWNAIDRADIVVAQGPIDGLRARPLLSCSFGDAVSVAGVNALIAEAHARADALSVGPIDAPLGDARIIS
jgi:O-antigen biosynthesis protein